MNTPAQERAHSDSLPHVTHHEAASSEERAARLLLDALTRFIPDRATRYDFATKLCYGLSIVADMRVKETLFKVLART
ncbi:MAG TPA: hypothetical protein VK728_09970 [Candidatus Sulfotelmatobacter sp.]|jgi:hypothetical protein|nr:hypothetical protein [Candidatus Sulfotelmatobacter sp.]